VSGARASTQLTHAFSPEEDRTEIAPVGAVPQDFKFDAYPAAPRNPVSEELPTTPRGVLNE